MSVSQFVPFLLRVGLMVCQTDPQPDPRNPRDPRKKMGRIEKSSFRFFSILFMGETKPENVTQMHATGGCWVKPQSPEGERGHGSALFGRGGSFVFIPLVSRWGTSLGISHCMVHIGLVHGTHGIATSLAHNSPIFRRPNYAIHIREHGIVYFRVATLYHFVSHISHFLS